jgi:hypothetical protein
MKKSMTVCGIFVAAAAIGLCTFSGDAAAYTRRVCGITGLTDGTANWSFGNCSIRNTDTSIERTVKYSIPIDSTANLSANAYVSGGVFAPYQTCATLRSIQHTVTYDSDSECTLSGNDQQIGTIGPISVPSGGSASVVISLGAEKRVYDVEVTQ